MSNGRITVLYNSEVWKIPIKVSVEISESFGDSKGFVVRSPFFFMSRAFPRGIDDFPIRYWI